jgi:leucine dehydrogenase
VIARGLPGAKVIVSDVDPAQDLAREWGFDWVRPEASASTPADILAPAAVGGVFSPATVVRLEVPLIVSPANNQLTEYSLAERLAGRGIA